MSVLIAYKKGDTIYMGTDTRITVDDYKWNETCETNYKIQRLENGILLGMTGERLERQTIFAYPEIFTLDKKGELTRKHIVKEIVPRLMAMLDKEGLLMEGKEDTTPYFRGSILLAYQDVMYEICCSFTVLRYEDYQSVGTSGDYAQATLFNAREEDDPNERIIKALEITAKHTATVGAPFLLIDTKEQKYRIVGGK